MRLAILFFAVLMSQNSWGWGGRGHHLICHVATRLVKEKNLFYFLAHRADQMGHLCNIPDIYWRDIPTAKTGNASHFLNPEEGNLDLINIPPSIKAYLKSDKYKEDTDSQARADRMGTLWWRAQQFYEKGVNDGMLASQSPAPTKDQERNDEYPFNKGIHGFVVNMGLMGHFVGDSTMPFHTTDDYDGWSTGHGGIHSFYETTCVNYFNLSLAQEVYLAAVKTPATPTDGSEPAFTAVRDITLKSAKEKGPLLALDVLEEPSSMMGDAMGVKKAAKRKPVNVACPKFHNLIVVQLSRSAMALATLWDKAYVAAGSPDLNRYRSYKYPFMPDFVGLDYLSLQ